MSIALLVVTDGRTDYLAQCVHSLCKRLRGPVGERFMYDDTGDVAYRLELAERYPEFTHINAGPRQGFGGAIANAWSQVYQLSEAEHVFHVEQDFTFNRDIDLTAMAGVLDDQPHLAQVALRRQPWNDAERAAGGIVEQHPASYVDCGDGTHQWLEHRLFYTTNPSLIRRSLIARGWPDVPRSEGEYSHYLLRTGTPEATPEEVRFAYWGRREDGPWVEHIGHQRTGTGY